MQRACSFWQRLSGEFNGNPLRPSRERALGTQQGLWAGPCARRPAGTPSPCSHFAHPSTGRAYSFPAPQCPRAKDINSPVYQPTQNHKGILLQPTHAQVFLEVLLDSNEKAREKEFSKEQSRGTDKTETQSKDSPAL